MIEIRTFEGDAEELAAFTCRVWRQSYEGKMLTPLWSKEFMGRDLLPDGSKRDFLIAAYEGSRLVGSHPAKPLKVRVHGQEIDATWASFISVDPEYRRRGVALKLQEEYVRRHRERDLLLNFGYLYIRSAKSLGPKFWLLQPGGVRLVSKLGFWVRALDHEAVARFELYRLESWGSRAMSLLQRPPREPADTRGIRPYRPTDLKACCTMLNRAGDEAHLAYVWDADNAARQLDYPNLSRTVVLEQQGRVAGLVNYTLLEVLGRSPMRVAVLDNVAFGSLPSNDRRRLLAAALCEMAADGAKGAMMIRGSWYAWPELLGAGFLPMPPEFYYVGLTLRNDISLEGIRRLHVLWR
jgi:GNAT superfamily N-acetyltransferase